MKLEKVFGEAVKNEVDSRIKELFPENVMAVRDCSIAALFSLLGDRITSLEKKSGMWYANEDKPGVLHSMAGHTPQEALFCLFALVTAEKTGNTEIVNALRKESGLETYEEMQRVFAEYEARKSTNK